MRITGLPYLVVVVVCLLFACSTTAPPPPPEPTASAEAADEAEPEEGDLVALIKTNKGDITVKLLPEIAPQTVERFVQLARAGFYMRTTFHYVSRGFIWGGDPYSRDNDPANDGTGNSGSWIGPEIEDGQRVERGAVGMMRKDNDPNSSSCQFFIVLRRKSEWDGKYNLFGEVIDGFDVAEEIAEVPTMREPQLQNRPAAKQIITRIEIERRKLEAEAEEATS